MKYPQTHVGSSQTEEKQHAAVLVNTEKGIQMRCLFRIWLYVQMEAGMRLWWFRNPQEPRWRVPSRA
jgi:hypothetical protein